MSAARPNKCSGRPGPKGASPLIHVLYGRGNEEHCGTTILAAVERPRGATRRQGRDHGACRARKGCAAWVGVTALAGVASAAPRPRSFLRDAGPASLPAREWSWLTAVARTECT